MAHRSPNGERIPGFTTLSKYGLTPDKYRAILDEQEGVCGICMRPEFLMIDHDHATGEVRGLLCGSCNYALGCLGDNVTRAVLAAAYLIHWPAKLDRLGQHDVLIEYFGGLAKLWAEEVARVRDDAAVGGAAPEDEGLSDR